MECTISIFHIFDGTVGTSNKTATDSTFVYILTGMTIINILGPYSKAKPQRHNSHFTLSRKLL